MIMDLTEVFRGLLHLRMFRSCKLVSHNTCEYRREEMERKIDVLPQLSDYFVGHPIDELNA